MKVLGTLTCVKQLHDSLWLRTEKPQLHVLQKFSRETVRETEQRTQGVNHISFERIEAPVVYNWLQVQSHKQRSNAEKLLETPI